MNQSAPEIVWVYGSSAAGKETFIKKVIDNKLPEVITALAWGNKKIKISEESIAWIAQHDDDPIKQKRLELLKKIPEMLTDENEVVLIKGQDYDLENHIPEKLLELTPHTIHRVVFLDLPFKEVFERIKNKPWWNKETDTYEELKEWLEYQIELLQKLPEKFIFTALDSSETGTYSEVPFPPKNT